jgi:2-polyprenyl-6-methoxyphenol hydroxylase-like FAD-dependent oxidoreductase
VTLIGDAVFKCVSLSVQLTDSNSRSISTMLGKGANCALLDALDLAETLRKSTTLAPSTRRIELRKCAAENVKRRLRERQRSALIGNLVYFGDSKLKEFCREHGLKMALGWIDDPRAKDFHSTK